MNMKVILQEFDNILCTIGIKKLSSNILFLGLDNSGKTTLIVMLEYDKLKLTPPTIHPYTVSVDFNNITLNILDIGGNMGVRRKWPESYLSHQIEGVAFIIDAADEERIEEAKTELFQFLSIPEWSSIPVVILGNKIDLKHTLTEERFKELLEYPLVTSNENGYKNITKYHNHDVMLCMSSIVRRIGYGEGFKWLSERIYYNRTKKYQKFKLFLQFIFVLLVILFLILLVKFCSFVFKESLKEPI